MKPLWEILVPTVKDAAKNKFYTARYHRVWDVRVRETTGGLTILSPSKGQWVSPHGETFVERMIPVRIHCTEDEINRIADFTASYYNQQAIFFYKVSDHVVVKHYK
jgi:hypothetical protein